MLQCDGVPVYTHKDKKRVFHTFYSDLLGTSLPMSLFALAPTLPPVAGLTDLDEPFTVEEVKAALWDMRTYNSPGPNGFGLDFFRVLWTAI
jgi:hypothetical protein